MENTEELKMGVKEAQFILDQKPDSTRTPLEEAEALLDELNKKAEELLGKSKLSPIVEDLKLGIGESK